MADDLRPVDALGQERKWRGIGIAGLRFELGEVDGAAIEARRRARLQPRPIQAQRAQLVAQQLRRRLAVASAGIPHLPDVRQAVQKRSRGDHHRAGFDASGHRASRTPVTRRSAISSAATSACLIRRFGSCSRTSRMRTR